MPFASIYSQKWDVVVFGAGYAGFAAALECRRRGKRVLLVDRRAAMVSESGWAFATEVGSASAPLWKEWMGVLTKRGAARDGQIDGAIAEVLATELCRQREISVLYYTAPLAVDLRDGLLAGVVMGGKSGLHSLSASQWIDATDQGELAGLLDAGWASPKPDRQFLNLYFRVARDAKLSLLKLDTPPELPRGTELHWGTSFWKNEGRLGITLPGDFQQSRRAWLPALAGLHAAVDLKGAVLSHGSVVPFVRHEQVTTTGNLPENILFVGAAGSTLAQRFEAGVRTANLLGDRPVAQVGMNPDLPYSWPEAALQNSSDVVVAGLGTGGAVAALAAARAGASVLAFDPFPFAGGIGSGGGVHVYYFGVKGGLQEEIDARTREIMPHFGSPAQVGGFHPDAKKIALEEMLAEAGVQTNYETSLVAVSSEEGLVTEALVTTSHGPMRFRAKTWVDATGDADLSAMAGASYRLGRIGDGLLHAYSQSSGKVRWSGESAKMEIVNFDSGFCDPTDEQDLTRARLDGVRQYVQERYDAEERPTYLAPAIGLRQSRHIETEYTLSLDDLITRRRFADAVGYTGGHYDNHARDYEFETDEAAFWVWICHQWYGRLACEIPYRILLPKKLGNVVLACRAVGVSEEAHHSLRMQRDIQRIGEAAGIAAALAAQEAVDCRNISYEKMREILVGTGALHGKDLPDSSFGVHADQAYFQYDQGQIEKWMEELKGGPATEALWHLYRLGDPVRDQVASLLEAEDDTVSWRAAAILSMWNDSRAEKRLGRAVIDHEDARDREIVKTQQEWFYVPRWYSALTFLKRCASPASLSLFENLADDPKLLFNLRTALALACESLSQRHPLSDSQRACLLRILDKLIATTAPRAVRTLHESTVTDPETRPPLNSTDRPPVLEDCTWQLHYAVAKVRLSLGEAAHQRAIAYLDDPRRIVRQTMARIASAGHQTVQSQGLEAL